MIVVSDTTPIRYLVFISEVHVLPELFGFVHVTPEIIGVELQGRNTPAVVRLWADSPPQWLIKKAPDRIDETLPVSLHRGEIEAISLAQELKADLFLVDDRDARQAAEQRNLRLAGTLAIVEEAGVRGLIEVEQVVEKLRKTNFYATEEQYRGVIERARNRHRADSDQTG